MARHDILPAARWGPHSITRLVVGHNPMKGTSHFSRELDEEMGAWGADPGNVVAMLRRCEECGVTTAQFGGELPHRALAAHREAGGRMQWIATLYGNESGDLGVGARLGMEEELRAILDVDPRPIGVQHFGEKTDRLFFAGKLELVRERLKRVRDAGVLVGVCSHLREVAERIASEGWDVDFYQTCLYTVYSKRGRKAVDREDEIYRDEDREEMLDFVARAGKPCLVFKALGANRKCATDEQIEQTLRHVYSRIKPVDAVCVGMWQRHRDQVAHNASLVRRILGG